MTRPAGIEPAINSSHRARHHRGFWIIAGAFVAAMAFSTIPTPLYAIYQARDGFPAFMVTVIFAAYAVGVVLSLYLVGSTSDWLGRKPLIVAAIGTEVIAAGIFLLWPEVPGLLVARVITGIGVGALTATATAYLGELRNVSHPGQERLVGTVSTLVNIGGLGLGPLIAGALAAWVTAPLVTPYLVFVVILVAAAVAVLSVPETVVRPAVRPVYHPQRFALPHESRGTFWSAAAAAFAAFAILGLFTSLAPAFVAGTLHETSRFVAGAVTFSVFGSAAVTQVLTSGLSSQRQLRLAAGLMGAGLITLSVGVLTETLAVFVVGGIIAGAGVGVQFRSSLVVAASLARPEARSEVLALTFLIAYIGLAVPVLLVGVALAYLSSTAAFVGFAAIVGVLAVGASLSMSRRKQ